jgi:ATP-binding cassette subfamily G (WHITE) protein 2 (SNQ2)
MLDTIGAGATADASVNWHDIWKRSPEAVELQAQIEQIHAEGRARPSVETERHSEFATSWIHQTVELTKRNFVAYWRNPTYLVAKIVLSTAGGLLIGLTFLNSKDSLQGTQNKLFVRSFHASSCVVN